ncbi:MAG TPA: nucleotide exchange factor GrpE [Actinomycetota bacterium]|jgi:molecular chaperone GrpE|nr:nucleotide exchange factor GrpE [Actinomycetota bacterium]
MTDHDRPESDEREEEARRVKVTDKRRVHLDEPESPGTREERKAGHAAGRGGPSTSEAGGRSEAPPADSEPGEALDAAQAKAAEYLGHLQRLQAEFDNYRKRVLREQTRAVELASEPLMRKLLEVLDEFDLALMSGEKQPEYDRFLHGVELVYAKLKEILRQEGLEQIDAKGKPFDPTLHEALLESHPDEDVPAGDEPVVVDVLRPGYTLRGQVIRPAGVKVARS